MENEMIKKIVLFKSNSDYRFGDIVFHKGWPPKYDEWKNSQKNILNDEKYNNTILKEYILKNNNNLKVPSKEKIRQIFSEIIDKKIIEKKFLVPKKDELVIHLRAGDVASYSWFLEKPYIELIKKYLCKYDIKSITFVTGLHYGNNKVNSNNKTIFKYNESIHKINIDKLKTLFKKIILNFSFLIIDLLSSEDIDQDFVYMCKANYLILDRGGFSKLIGIIQNSNNDICV